MHDTGFESRFKNRLFKVVVPHVPYLPSDQVTPASYQRIKDDDQFYKYIKLKIFPLDDLTYSYQEAVDVLEIFTARWLHGNSDPWTEPYAKAVGDPEITFTLSEFKNNKDADILLEKFCKNRKRKDGLGGKIFAKQEEEEDHDELLD
jgi:hypothetical protein